MPTMSDYLGTLEVNAQVLLSEVQRLRALHAAGNLPYAVTNAVVWHAERRVCETVTALKDCAPQHPIMRDLPASGPSRLKGRYRWPGGLPCGG